MKCSIIIFILAGFFFSGCKSTKDTQESESKARQSIRKTWVLEEEGRKEVMTITETEITSVLTGEGMGSSGYTDTKKIAKISPGVHSESGVVVLGPNNKSLKPYSSLRWFRLSESSVEIFLSGESFQTPEEAERKSKGDENGAKVYTLQR